MYSFLAWTSQVILLLLGLFLMIIVLLQRGRGGGLAGAFGGMGGQSAFGTKAGDVFTRITIVVALLWVITAGGSGFFLRAAAEQTGRQQFGDDEPAATAKDPDVPNKAAGDVPARPTPPTGTTTEGAAPAGDATAPATDGATTPATEAAAPVSEPAAETPAATDPAANDAATPATEPSPPGKDQQQN